MHRTLTLSTWRRADCILYLLLVPPSTRRGAGPHSLSTVSQFHSLAVPLGQSTPAGESSTAKQSWWVLAEVIKLAIKFFQTRVCLIGYIYASSCWQTPTAIKQTLLVVLGISAAPWGPGMLVCPFSCLSQFSWEWGALRELRIAGHQTLTHTLDEDHQLLWGVSWTWKIQLCVHVCACTHMHVMFI